MQFVGQKTLCEQALRTVSREKRERSQNGVAQKLLSDHRHCCSFMGPNCTFLIGNPSQQWCIHTSPRASSSFCLLVIKSRFRLCACSSSCLSNMGKKFCNSGRLKASHSPIIGFRRTKLSGLFLGPDTKRRQSGCSWLESSQAYTWSSL